MLVTYPETAETPSDMVPLERHSSSVAWSWIKWKSRDSPEALCQALAFCDQRNCGTANLLKITLQKNPEPVLTIDLSNFLRINYFNTFIKLFVGLTDCKLQEVGKYRYLVTS